MTRARALSSAGILPTVPLCSGAASYRRLSYGGFTTEFTFQETADDPSRHHPSPADFPPAARLRSTHSRRFVMNSSANLS